MYISGKPKPNISPELRWLGFIFGYLLILLIILGEIWPLIDHGTNLFSGPKTTFEGNSLNYSNTSKS